MWGGGANSPLGRPPDGAHSGKIVIFEKNNVKKKQWEPFKVPKGIQGIHTFSFYSV